MQEKTIQAVIFDYGNVLCVPQPREDVVAMAEIFGLPLDRFEELYWRKRLPYDRTEMTPEEYWEDFQRMAGVEPSPDRARRAMALDCRSWAHPNPAMIAWAKRVRESGFKTAILSNMPLSLRVYLDAEHPWIHEFDHRVFSCDVGMAKPELAIYALCLRGLGVEAEDSLFLDDRAENIGAAHKAGLRGLLFSTAGQAAQELNGRYGLPALAA